MEQIRKAEAEMEDLRGKKKELENKKNKKGGSSLGDEADEKIVHLEEKIQTRKKVIDAVVKNVEVNTEYVNKQEQKLSSGIIYPSPRR